MPRRRASKSLTGTAKGPDTGSHEKIRRKPTLGKRRQHPLNQMFGDLELSGVGWYAEFLAGGIPR